MPNTISPLGQSEHPPPQGCAAACASAVSGSVNRIVVLVESPGGEPDTPLIWLPPVRTVCSEAVITPSGKHSQPFAGEPSPSLGAKRIEKDDDSATRLGASGQGAQGAGEGVGLVAGALELNALAA